MHNTNAFCVRSAPPKSNAQRQREFRARNPHYYRDLHRRKKAERQARARLMAEHPELTFEQAYAIVKGHAPAPGIQTPAPGMQTPLALPAARSEPLVTVQLPLFDQAPEPAPLQARPKPTPAQVVEQLKNAA